MLCSLLLPQVHLAGEVLVRNGDVNRNLFFIHQGQVDVVPSKFQGLQYVVPQESSEKIILADGAQFGEVTFFLGRAAMASIVCLSNCQLLVVGRESFMHILSSFTYIRERIINNLLAIQYDFLKDYVGFKPEELNYKFIDSIFMKTWA